MECCPDLPNLPNLRDLGGFPAADGRTTKRGLVFRSDDLSDLDGEERARLAALNLRAVVDFRSLQERLYAPDILPDTVVNPVSLPIDAGRLIDNYYGGSLNRRKTMGLMVSVYRQLVREFVPQYAQFFKILAEPGNVPLLFHCTAGKDRTGVAAVLFLSSLGVDREMIVGDYLLSAERLKKKYARGIDYDEVSEPMYFVFPEFIAAAFAIIDAEPGGMEGYLRDTLGVDMEYMRKTFTE